MWAMLCARATDLQVSASDVQADDLRGRAHWDASYTFGQTGRKVLNRIDAEFEFRDGLIIRHTDTFDFYAWARQDWGPRLCAWGGRPCDSRTGAVHGARRAGEVHAGAAAAEWSAGFPSAPSGNAADRRGPVSRGSCSLPSDPMTSLPGPLPASGPPAAVAGAALCNGCSRWRKNTSRTGSCRALVRVGVAAQDRVTVEEMPFWDWESPPRPPAGGVTACAASRVLPGKAGPTRRAR